jgi:hypothetical protein
MEYLNTLIRRTDGFADLYADSGIPEPEAPRIKKSVKFKVAVEQFTDDDLRAIREYDRARHGGFNASS